MTPVHFTALSMVDISYFVDAQASLPACSFTTNGCTAESGAQGNKWEGSAAKWSVRLGGQEQQKAKAQNNLYAPWRGGDVCERDYKMQRETLRMRTAER